VPAHAPQALADGLVDFLQHRDRWRAWARAGRQMVEAQFDFRTRTRKLEALYVEMMESRGQR
jgi:glycosyltransferase involved in cell wall biosynthesis